MKTYVNLYEQYISEENIRLSVNNSSKGKRNRREVKAVYENINKWLPKIEHYATYFHNQKHKPKIIYDGISRKKRIIIVPRYDEQVIHHMVVNTLKPMFLKGMYEFSMASTPNRGCHLGKKYINKWINNDPAHCKYCLKMDIKKYFNSIPHDILKAKLENKIKDEDFLKILFEIIDVSNQMLKYPEIKKDFPEIEYGKGLPLGFYTSQWFANWYLQDLDHYIKEVLKAPHYMRYMDDMVIFGSNKKQLHKMQEAIQIYLKDELGLTMKENWQVFRFHYVNKKDGSEHGRFLDFMGFRFYRNRTTLRHSIMLKSTRKAKRMSKKKKPTVYDCKQMISYIGWLKATDTHNMYCNRIKKYISFKKIKKRVSKNDKRKMKERYALWSGSGQNLQQKLNLVS